jgi:chromosome segregation ATPase
VLERELGRLREEAARDRASTEAARVDASAARVLAAGADRDVTEVRAELRAHTQSLNALRETQVEQGNQLQDLRAEMRAGFATLNTGMTAITELLGRIAGDEEQRPQ